MLFQKKYLGTLLAILGILAINNISYAKESKTNVGQGAVVHSSDLPPNIIVMLVDNVGWGDIGIYGGGELRGAPTPRIDALAQEGMRLLNFNVTPYCSPSRAAFLTGRYPVRTGSHNKPHLNKEEVTMAEMLAGEGYATAMFGKWHLGEGKGYYPTDRGFDEWYGIPSTSRSAEWDTRVQYDPVLAPMQNILYAKKGQTPKKVKVYDIPARREIDSEIAQKSIAFIKRNAAKKQPFFLYIPFTQTHSPTLPHPNFDGKTGNGRYADALAELDYRTGEALDAIDHAGIRSNTIVIWASDNGPSTQYPHGATGYWRGSAGTTLEGALRVPFMIRWPNKIKAGGVNNEIVHITDLLPTLMHAAGHKIPSKLLIDGVDQMNFFSGQKETSNREGFPISTFGADDQFVAYKWRNWKVHYSDKWGAKPGIYNLLIDPWEEHPMGRESSWVYPVIGKKLQELNATLDKSY